MLGEEIRVVQPFSLFEHVLAEYAFVQTRSRNGGHMVEMPGIDGFGEFHRVARALDVHGRLALGIGRQVVHGSEMVEMVDLALELLHILGRNAELAGCQVTKHRHRAGGAHAPVAAQFGHFTGTFLAQQEIHHAALALQEFFNQPLANKPCGTCHEILHVENSC